MVALIFLAGGTGSRMGSSIPKQYLPLQGKPIALHSLDRLKTLPDISEIVIVCAPEYRFYFPESALFADPGLRRQDSVLSGLLKSSQEMVLIHDAARPFVELKYIPPLLKAAQSIGAAALGVPAVNTIKECSRDHTVQKTLDRSLLWEMQSPQAIQRTALLQAFEHAQKYGLEATDDLSMIEAIGRPSCVVPSSPRNFKITTPFDFEMAQKLCATN